MTNPVMIELWRGALVESRHRGALAVVDAAGRPVLSVGDTAGEIFPRSAVKALQALPLVETGAAGHYGFGDAELALACASHVGSLEHVRIAAGMLAKAGAAPEALACGAHAPLQPASAAALRAAGQRPTDLHNNCSGKHAGMIATALHLGEPVEGYWRAEHPVQQRVRRAIEGLSGCVLGDHVAGIDGCSVPNWAMPLEALALAFARLAAGEHPAATRLMQACWARPDMVGGEGRLDTRLMAALPGEVFSKTGAEGVYCAGLPRLGLGIAVKIDDGAARAAEAIVTAVIARLVAGADKLMPSPVQRNWRGIETGRLAPAAGIVAALDRLGP